MKSRSTVLSVILGIGIWLFYLFFQSTSIFGGDAGDLVSASYVWGISHPPGYPLYTFIAGILIRIIPLFTSAWRVSLLSSSFAAWSVVLLYTILIDVVKDKYISLVGALILAFVYPFWLYASVPEIFALSLWIILLIIYLLQRLTKTYSSKYLWLLAFVLGLSLTHHHVVIVLIPTILAFVIPIWKELVKRFTPRIYLISGVTFLLGLLPLLYLPISAYFWPAVDYEHPTSISSFFRLFLRSSYGTFKAGPFVNDTVLGRGLAIASFIKLYLIDFKVIGAVLLLYGIFYAFKSKNKYFWPFFLGLLSYGFFIIYSSFPLLNDFALATFERFIIFPYFFAIVFMSLGIQSLIRLLSHIRIIHRSKRYPHIIAALVSIVFLVYPIGMALRNAPYIYSLKNDRTAEGLGRDILTSAPYGSLILLINDSAIFDSQYVYYTEGFRNKTDLVPIHLYKLFQNYYQTSLKRNYPRLVLPKTKVNDDQNFIDQFVRLNANSTPVFTNFYVPTIKNKLVPQGLLLRYYPDAMPDVLVVIRDNERLWSRYQILNPNDIKFRNLFLVDVLRIYSTAHQNYAFYLLLYNRVDKALEEIRLAHTLTPSDRDILVLFGQAYERKSDCTESEKYYLDYKTKEPDNGLIYDYLINLASTCFKDEQKMKSYLNQKNLFLQGQMTKASNL